ncbi:MAG: SDR family NAD(P)-dependent oxidoreductase [Acidobacteria bacterium]|nr:SDR family NAD(P)-dependent oxidoreductase [Acidobacteriota bacterium]
MGKHEIAVVTGASAGIGAATARALAEAGYGVVLGARRLDRLRALAAEIGGQAFELDVTDEASVEAFAAAAGVVRVVVNNAGLSRGLEPVAETDSASWTTMYETNVLGAMRVARAFIPGLIESGDGHLVHLGSIAGFEVYPGGAGYTASKHALRALTKTLRLELLGQPVRVTEICPGLVETEFSLVRFDGDAERARAVYAGLQPLLAEDVAECVVWAVSRPPHVNIDEIVVRPRDQATSTAVHRRA